MSQQPPPAKPQMADRVELNYAPPVGRARLTTLVLGLSASLFFAVGAGLTAGGMMMAWQNDREGPVVLAFGVGCIVFGAGIIVTALISRR